MKETTLAEFALSLSEETWKVIANFPGSALLIDGNFRVYIPRTSARMPLIHDEDFLTHPQAVKLVKLA